MSASVILSADPNSFIFLYQLPILKYVHHIFVIGILAYYKVESLHIELNFVTLYEAVKPDIYMSNETLTWNKQKQSVKGKHCLKTQKTSI